MPGQLLVSLASQMVIQCLLFSKVSCWSSSPYNRSSSTSSYARSATGQPSFTDVHPVPPLLLGQLLVILTLQQVIRYPFLSLVSYCSAQPHWWSSSASSFARSAAGQPSLTAGHPVPPSSARSTAGHICSTAGQVAPPPLPAAGILTLQQVI